MSDYLCQWKPSRKVRVCYLYFWTINVQLERNYQRRQRKTINITNTKHKNKSLNYRNIAIQFLARRAKALFFDICRWNCIRKRNNNNRNNVYTREKWYVLKCVNELPLAVFVISLHIPYRFVIFEVDKTYQHNFPKS